MVLLSDFIGELVSDISDARRIADSNSAALSQSYHADPFLRGMPVPHYTINEAEVKFPVSVLSVLSNSNSKDVIGAIVLNAIKLKLPHILNNQFVSSYINKRKKELKTAAQERRAEVMPGSDMATTDAPLAENGIVVSEELKKTYAESANRIEKDIEEPMNEFLSVANFEVIKLLDIKDTFVKNLKIVIRDVLGSLSAEDQPINEDGLDELVVETGKAMFFEFKQMLKKEKGVFVEPKTGKINEYGSMYNQMVITLKIREQDLDLIVEDGNGSSTHRFLSLN